MGNHHRLVLAHETATPKPAGIDVIEALYVAARDPHRWPETLALLAAHLGAESAMVAACDTARRVSSIVTSTVSVDSIDAAQAPSDVWTVASEVSRRASIPATDKADGERLPVVVVRGKAATGGPRVHLVLPYPPLCGADRAGWISVALHPTQTLRSEQVAGQLAALCGHLIRALDISLELANARNAGPSLAILLSALPTAALVLDMAGRVTQVNLAARALLHEANGIFETAERLLRASIAQEDQKLAPAIQASLAASKSEPSPRNRHAIRVRRPSGSAPLLIILDPLPLQHRAPLLDEAGGAVLLRVIDEGHAPDGRTYPLQAAFDLTAAETRIAAAIASGRSPALAARQLDLSTNTVRTHLGRVFDKTGTRSQHALTRLLAAIGSWPLA